MGRLEAYLKLAPFSLEELVQAVNTLVQDRPRLRVTRRTVRFYVSENVLPPPTGSPKYARYSADHLMRILAIRSLQDEGMSLDEVKGEVNRIWHLDPVLKLVQIQEFLSRGTSTELLRKVMEPQATYAMAPPSEPAPVLSKPQTVTRIQLTEDVTLEIAGGLDQRQALIEAAEAIENIMANL